MFQQEYVRLLAVFGGSGFHPAFNPVATGEPSRYAEEALPLSARVADRERWRRLRVGRRQRLLKQLENASAASMTEVCDLVAAICEELRWSDGGDGALFDDPNAPVIDRFAAETGALMAWTICALGDRLEPRAVSTLRAELRRRLLTPVAAHESYPFLKGAGADALLINCDLLLCEALSETDASRFTRVTRLLLKGMDACFDRPARLRPLKEVVDELTALADLAALLGFENPIPLEDGLDELMCAWVGGDLFLDPAGDGRTRALPGVDVYRLGAGGGDAAACRLGAYLNRMKPRLPLNVTGRLTAGRALDAMEAVREEPPRLRAGASRDQLRMLVRSPDFICAMNGAAGCRNAGDVALLSSAEAILSGGSGAYSVPVIDGESQIDGEAPCALENVDGREMLSIDLTRVYPEVCGVRAYQRTLVVSRAERSIRWVDAVSLDSPKEIELRFVLGVRPSVFATAARFGRLRLTWEGEMAISTRLLSDGRTLMTFKPERAVSRGLYAFTFDWGE